LHFIEKEVSALCSSSKQLFVYFENIPIRFSHITDFPFPENLYALLSSLSGYQYIYDKIRNFDVLEDQFCITADGEIKVWINADLSKNYPDKF
jgi:hypothetical protein